MYFMCMCVLEPVYVSHLSRSLWKSEELDPLELKMQAFVSCPVDVGNLSEQVLCKSSQDF